MFHVKHEGWGSVALSPAQQVLLVRFEELLRTRATPLGMVASSDLQHLRTRHIADSLRALDHIGPDARRGCDLGSGAGLPGIPIAIARPDLEITLTESRRTRAAFLELAIEALELTNVAVIPGPLEQLSDGFDVCFARGYAGPERAWASAARLLRRGGRLLYWAGATFSIEHAPEGIEVSVAAAATLESGGPMVIMARQ